MAAPWKSSTKIIDSSGYTHHPYYASKLFVPPPLITTLTTSPAKLFTAMAKMQALRTAKPALLTALTRATATCIEAIIDDLGPDFDLAPEAETLERTFRSALAGSVGAGICHLYMISLGYVWHNFAADVVTRSGKLADFVYDGGFAGGHGVVLAEAKGSFASSTTAKSTAQRAQSAYISQVEPHIGASTRSPHSQRIVHGYAIAFGAQPASVLRNNPMPHAWIHVSETGYPAANMRVRGDAGNRENGVAGLIALGNYRAAFMLAGAWTIVEALDRLRSGERRSSGLVQNHRFTRVLTDAGSFLVGMPSEDDAGAWSYNPKTPWGTFAIEENLARAFLEQLSDVPERGQLPDRFALKPTRFLAEDRELRSPLVFPDGLALVPQRAELGREEIGIVE